MNNIRSEAETHRLIGGVLCLDFANTLNGHGKARGHEYLRDYCDLVLWCRKAGSLPGRDAQSLVRAATRQPDKAAATFKRAIALRETLYRIFSAIACGGSPKATDLAELTQARSDALARSQIVRTAGGFVVAWADRIALDRMLWPITLSAADVLTSGDTSRIHQCAGEGCDWLFLDTSRNHMRRWCSMDECGNRAKSQRFLERKRRSGVSE